MYIHIPQIIPPSGEDKAINVGATAATGDIWKRGGLAYRAPGLELVGFVRSQNMNTYRHSMRVGFVCKALAQKFRTAATAVV